MNIDELISRLEKIRKKYGGECIVSRVLHTEGERTLLNFVDCIDVCDAKPVFKKGELYTGTCEFVRWSNEVTPPNNVRVLLFW